MTVDPMKVQLAKFGAEDDLAREDYLLEEKLDGTRCVAIKHDGHVHLMSRSWKNDFAPAYPQIVAEIQNLPGDQFVLDGELVFYNRQTGKPEFLTAEATLQSRAAYRERLMVFDILEYGGLDLRPNPLATRKNTLALVVPQDTRCRVQRVRASLLTAGFMGEYRRILANGGEGVVLKRIDSPYSPGARNGDWIKVKREETEDCFVLGITYGTGVNQETFGALRLGQYDARGRMRVVGHASGFTGEMREEMYRRVMAMPDGPAIGGDQKKVKKFVRPELVVEVKFMERFATGQMRNPRFVRIRDDKPVDECRTGQTTLF